MHYPLGLQWFNVLKLLTSFVYHQSTSCSIRCQIQIGSCDMIDVFIDLWRLTQWSQLLGILRPEFANPLKTIGVHVEGIEFFKLFVLSMLDVHEWYYCCFVKINKMFNLFELFIAVHTNLFFSLDVQIHSEFMSSVRLWLNRTHSCLRVGLTR